MVTGETKEEEEEEEELKTQNRKHNFGFADKLFDDDPELLGRPTFLDGGDWVESSTLLFSSCWKASQ